MRSFVAGTDSSGRSSIHRVVDIDPTGITGLWPHVAVNALVSPTDAPIDIGLRPGDARCTTVFFPPGSRVPVGSPRQPSMHWTKTVDFVVVLAGQIRLIVDTGDATMDVGDIAIVPSVKHDWRAGSEGCLLFVLGIGSA
jgi:quercetin dioxygenase-like cupin family protein